MALEKNAETPAGYRSIKSYVVRAGRMTIGQKNALEKYWPAYGLTISDGPLDTAQLFLNHHPVVLEIGFGMGHSLIELAKRSSEKNFIGIEVHPPGVGKLLQIMQEEELSNIRVYAEDALEVLAQAIPDQSLDEVLLFFPDPWPKKKHHKRRIVKAEFAQLIRSKLKIGATFHMATDWQPYAEWMLAVMTTADGFVNCAGKDHYSPRPASRPVTKFEQRGERLGHGVWDLLFTRLN